MFADDLLMFCKGDAPSILLLVIAFTSFSNAPGLQMNNAKSEIFFNGMNVDLQTDILSVTGFQEGKMPFRYLGVPIQLGKVSKKECNSLVEKMVIRIRSIGAKKLYYAGRVVLINSVLNTLYNYWAAMFVIPKAAIKRVEAICRNFLWDSSTEYHRVPLVGWDRVTMSKSVGGLGIKKASTWTIASVGKLTWKTICKVKEQLKNGFIDNCWAPHKKGYTIGNGYEWLMGTTPTQHWTKIVWNEWNVPKHSFNSWLIMQGGLNTKAKLFTYGCCQDDLCVLCAEQSETIEHLFTECKFSCQVQKYVDDWIERPFPTDSELLNFSVMRPVIVAERMKMVVQQQIRRFTDRRGGQTELDARTWVGFC
ncbi:uncharacterized protein LOC141628031 [Silene latifolia]|uniref:uncharacterized protein LOC141628031 n=1 Tax=Silene latifolia TaxID=37657 RepID=UPI003D76EAB2